MENLGNAEFFTVGLDIKKTPDAHFAVIELNGLASGIGGLQELTGEDVYQTRRKIKKEAEKKVFETMFERKKKEFVPDEAVSTVINANDWEYYDSEVNPFLGWWERSDEIEKDQIENLILKDIADLGKNLQNLKALARTKKSNYWWYGKHKSHKFLFDKPREMHKYGILRFALLPEIGLVLQVANWACFANTPETRQLLPGIKIISQKIYQRPEFRGNPFFLYRDETDVFLRQGRIYRFLAPPNAILVHDRQLGAPPKRVQNALKDLDGSIISDKIHHKEFIPEDYQAPHIIWNGDKAKVASFLQLLKETPHPLIDFKKFPFVVLKKRRSVCGQGVSIFSVAETADQEQFFRKLLEMPHGECLIEGFVPSDAFVLKGLDSKHEGCIRYLVDVKMPDITSPEFEILFEDGYNRLAPFATENESRSLNERFKINKSGNIGYIPEHIPPEMVDPIREISREVISNIVQHVVDQCNQAMAA